MTTTTPNRRMRRGLAAGAAVLFGVSALGACDLGNGSGPNCDEAVIEEIDDRISDLFERQSEIYGELDNPELSDFERFVLETELELVNAGIDLKYVALDLCDADEIPSVDEIQSQL